MQAHPELLRMSYILALMIVGQSYAYDDECRAWFERAKLKTGSDCLLKCASTTENFDSLGCSDQCSYLCKEKFSTQAAFKVTDLYGLTKSERALVAKDPVRALSAYRLSHTAESLCARLYKRSFLNDESDACRHFVWAALLSRDLGLEFANAVLNAHEDEPNQPADQRSMDLANNRQGQIAISTSKSKTDEAILKDFETNLERRALIILKPGAERIRKKAP